MKQINELKDLIGLELTSVIGGAVGDEEIIFKFSDGNELIMFHWERCSESVSIAEIDGDIQDLIGGILVEFEEASSADAEAPEHAESYTWTFYKVATTKGFVNIRWLGESNGYYSESVDLATNSTTKTNAYNVYVPNGYRLIN